MIPEEAILGHQGKAGLNYFTVFVIEAKVLTK